MADDMQKEIVCSRLPSPDDPPPREWLKAWTRKEGKIGNTVSASFGINYLWRIRGQTRFQPLFPFPLDKGNAGSGNKVDPRQAPVLGSTLSLVLNEKIQPYIPRCSSFSTKVAFLFHYEAVPYVLFLRKFRLEWSPFTSDRFFRIG